MPHYGNTTKYSPIAVGYKELLQTFENMPERVANAFEAYLGLGDSASLESLARKQGARSIATLKRWSTRYQWQMRLASYNRQRCERMHEAFMQSLVDRRQYNIKVVQSAIDRFCERVDIDPNDPNLTPAQRRRALKPITIAQFLRLIKVEQQLLGSLRSPIIPESKPNRQYTDEELDAMLRALAEVRYGLPYQPTKPKWIAPTYESLPG